VKKGKEGKGKGKETALLISFDLSLTAVRAGRGRCHATLLEDLPPVGVVFNSGHSNAKE
jgi:hypothetical protein